MPYNVRSKLQRSLPLPVYHILRRTDHILRRALGVGDPGWEFYAFEQSFHPAISGRYLELVNWSEKMAASSILAQEIKHGLISEDPIVQQGMSLLEASLTHYDGILGKEDLRVLVHIPAQGDSPGGWSAFMNMADSLTYMGVPTRILACAQNLQQVLHEFEPNLLLSGDHPIFTSNLDWSAIHRYRVDAALKVGLYTGPEPYGLDYSAERALWAESVHANFFFSFRTPAYVASNNAYVPYLEAGFQFAHIPFGANILQYHPVPRVQRDLPFVFLASQNPSKFRRYQQFMGKILANFGGFVDGPGWRHSRGFNFNRERDRYLYARARVGLNLHLDEQIDEPCEVNERTFQLAACGVPQLVDNPALLSILFGQESMFVARTPKEYAELFEWMLTDEEACASSALAAQNEVFARHTTFHRVLDFVEQIRLVNDPVG